MVQICNIYYNDVIIYKLLCTLFRNKNAPNVQIKVKIVLVSLKGRYKIMLDFDKKIKNELNNILELLITGMYFLMGIK